MIYKVLFLVFATSVSTTVLNAQVTSGKNESSLPTIETNSPKFRMDGNFKNLKILDIRPITNPEPFTSGMIKYQVGLLVCKRDPCNFISYMMDFDFPLNEYQLRIQTKINPFDQNSKSCENRGYSPSKTTLKQKITLPIRMEYVKKGDEIEVNVNGVKILQHYACDSIGTVIRSDNVQVKILVNSID